MRISLVVKLVAIVFLVIIGVVLSPLPQVVSRALASSPPPPTPPATAAYSVADGTLVGPLVPLANPKAGQDGQTKFASDPAKISSILIHPQYFQITGMPGTTGYTYPWKFSRRHTIPQPISVVTIGYNESRHTRILATGIATGALLNRPSGMSSTTAPVTTNPPSPAMPTTELTSTTTNPADRHVLSTNLPQHGAEPDITQSADNVNTIQVDAQTFDDVYLDLNDVFLSMSCTYNYYAVYNCSAWNSIFVFWESGWHLQNSYSSWPSPGGQEAQYEVDASFLNTGFCLTTPTYTFFTPVGVAMDPYGEGYGYANQWGGGVCAWLLNYALTWW